MDAYRIEKSKARVTLKLRGNVELPGWVFLPPEPSEEPIVTKIHQLMNGFEPFIPVETEGGLTVVQNKDRVMWCRYEGPIGPTVEVLLPRRRVTLVLEDGQSLAGDLVADGPPERRRVLDCLNQPEPYLLLEARDGDYLVRRDAITWVPSSELGDPREQEESEFAVEDPAEEVTA